MLIDDRELGPAPTGDTADNITHDQETDLWIEIERLIALALHEGRGRRYAAARVLERLRKL
jgi:hypothetical protein